MSVLIAKSQISLQLTALDSYRSLSGCVGGIPLSILRFLSAVCGICNRKYASFRKSYIVCRSSSHNKLYLRSL